MIMQILLTFGLGMICLYVLIQPHLIAFFKYMATLVVLVGGYFTWFPDDSSQLAHFLGVGRGADLVLYCWVVLSLFVSVNLNVKIQHNNRQITLITRRLALSAPQYPEDQAPTAAD